ncbi:MAG: DeoR/GlpR family DNA-binding transcription regulator, partial [Atribacterota bacterium]
MIAEERRLKILEILEEKKTVSVKELKEIFGVSEDTVRQDLKTLDEQKLLRRIYGGAVRIKKGSTEIPFSLRGVTNRDIKEAIGKEGAKLIEDGDCLIFDASTTALQVARNIDPTIRVTILTTSLDICISLARNQNVSVIATGGTLHPLSMSFIGPQAEAAIQNYLADCLFLGVKAISLSQKAIADVFELE